jgi:hypothetical protein
MSALLRDAAATLANISARDDARVAREREQTRQQTREARVEELHAIREHQARVDSILEPWGLRATPPLDGQSLYSYRCDQLERARLKLPPNHSHRRVDPYALDSATLGIMEKQIFPAVRDAARSPDSVPPGQFRAVPEVDQSGIKSTRFVGPQSFIHQFTRPGQRLVRLIARNAASGVERVLHGPPFSTRYE